MKRTPKVRRSQSAPVAPKSISWSGKLANLVKKSAASLLLGAAIFGAAWCETAQAQITTKAINGFNSQQEAAIQRAADYMSEVLPGVKRTIEVEQHSLVEKFANAFANPTTGNIWVKPQDFNSNRNTQIGNGMREGMNLQALMTHEMGHTFGIMPYVFSTGTIISGDNAWIDALAFFALPISIDNPNDIFWIDPGLLIPNKPASAYDSYIYRNDNKIHVNEWKDLAPAGINPEHWKDALKNGYKVTTIEKALDGITDIFKTVDARPHVQFSYSFPGESTLPYTDRSVYTFRGTHATLAYRDAWTDDKKYEKTYLPLENGQTMQTNDFMFGSSIFHPYGDKHGLMNAVPVSGIEVRPFFSEVELAVLKDVNKDVDAISNHFGRSLYPGNFTRPLVHKEGRRDKMLLSHKLQWNCNTFYRRTTEHSVP